MALIEILPDSNPVMRKTCRKIKHVDDELRQLIEDMYETMVDKYGIGLAACQVGVTRRFFIYEVPKRDLKGYETCRPDEGVETDDENDPVDEEKISESSDEPEIDEVEETDDEEEDEEDWGYTGDYTVCINPRIISREGVVIDDEGCLSKSGWMAKVERAYRVTFQAYDIDMEKFERTVEGLEARCILHETDHLDGILFTDRAEPGTLKEISELKDEDEDDEVEGEGEEKSDEDEMKSDTPETDESQEVPEGSTVAEEN